MGDWGNASVRVTGVRRGRFVEFDFAIDDDLVVELVLPYREFVTFCGKHDARMLPAEGEAALALSELAKT